MNDTVSLLYAAGIYVACFSLMFINYGSFAVTVVRWAKDPIVKKGTTKIMQPPMGICETLKCYIPMYQTCIVRKTLYGRIGVPLGIMSVFSIVGIVANLFNKFVWAIKSYVMLVCNIVMLIALLLFYLTYAIITADCAHLYGFSWMCIVMCFLLPHVSCWYLHNNIPRKMRAVHKEAIFNGRGSNTVIKQQHRK